MVGAGVVIVIRGSDTGVTSSGSELWHQSTSGVADTAEDGDLFGTTLATNRLDEALGTGFSDLIVGVPRKDVGSVLDAGAANVLYGSASGLTATGDQFLHQNSPGVLDAAEESDRFGTALSERQGNEPFP